MILKALKREILGKKVKHLRAKDLVPASIYGAKRNPALSLALSVKELREAFKQCGYSRMFDVEIEGEAKPSKAVFKDMQVDPLRGQIIHVSLYQVEMDKKITVEIPLHFNGISMAVKNNLGLFVTPLSKINVHCLPGDLPSSIELDISNLNDIGDTIMLDKIKLPEGVEVGHGTPHDAMLAYISAPQKVEEEVAPVAAEGDAAEAAPTEEGAEKAEGEAEEGKGEEKKAGDKKPEKKQEKKEKRK